VTATLQLGPILKNRFLNLTFCRPKTVMCQFRPCKQQQFAAGRSIDSDDASPRPLTSGRRTQRPIAHKSKTNSCSSLSPKLAEERSTTRATLLTSFKVKRRGHKLTSSVRLIYASSSFGKHNALLVSLQAGGGIPCRPNPAATPCFSHYSEYLKYDEETRQTSTPVSRA